MMMITTQLGHEMQFYLTYSSVHPCTATSVYYNCRIFLCLFTDGFFFLQRNCDQVVNIIAATMRTQHACQVCRVLYTYDERVCV